MRILCGQKLPEISANDFEKEIYAYPSSKLYLLNHDSLQFAIIIEASKFSILPEVYTNASRRRAAGDFLLRSFHSVIEKLSCTSAIITSQVDQYILDRSCLTICPTTGNVRAMFRITRQIERLGASDIITSTIPILIETWFKDANVTSKEAILHYQVRTQSNNLPLMYFWNLLFNRLTRVRCDTFE
jgi:hypothetical protein